MATIVLIEDDREIGSTLSAVLEGAGYRVVLATNGIDGQRLITAERPDLVITDMMMPRMGGFPVLEFLRTLDAPPKVIMITANEGGRHKAYAEMLGAVAAVVVAADLTTSHSVTGPFQSAGEQTVLYSQISNPTGGGAAIGSA